MIVNKKNERLCDILTIVIIINDRYVRWEEFHLHDRIEDVYKLLYNKYNIEKCIIEINELYLPNNTNIRLLDICKQLSATLYVTTKDKNYTLCKSIY
jgi:hypothetical protein